MIISVIYGILFAIVFLTCLAGVIWCFIEYLKDL